MVLESLIGVKGAENNPKRMIFLGILYATVAIFLASWIFKSEASMVMVSLTVFACIPLIYNTIKYEEAIDLKSNKGIYNVHKRALSYFVFLFMGFILAFSAWFIVLPLDQVSSLFSTQLSTIKTINSQITGGRLLSTYFLQIILNNIKVLLFAVLFSFFYGAGAIFILTWNASVISAAIGTFVRNNLEQYASAVGFVKIATYLGIFSVGILRYLTHGVFEILAYFMGGLAGGLISVAVIKHDFGSKEFRKVMRDSVRLIVIAILIILAAGIIETFITPILF